jgi:hypothetical protein
VSAIGVATVSTAPYSFSRAKRAACCDDEHYCDDEVHWLDHIMKGGHLPLEDVNERDTHEAPGPRSQ